MLIPDVPLLIGSTPEDVQVLRKYLFDLQRRLEEPLDTGWSTVGTTENKIVTSGGTLTDVENVLATLINTLIIKGYLTS